MAHRRKLLVDPADQESVISATESVKGGVIATDDGIPTSDKRHGGGK